MTIPNILTVLRGILGVVCGFILMHAGSLLSYLVYFFMFTIAAFTDLFDGQLARKTKSESNFGRIADPIADKILNLTSLFVLSCRGVFSPWWLVPIFVREIGITAIRIQKVLNGQVIAAEFAGKLKTTVQYFAIGFGFFVVMANQWLAGSWIEASLKLIFFVTFTATIIITLYSGFIFLTKIYSK